ncbi:MAG: hypothetical protein J0H68_06880 [Sphingobacteriia bacterium]|nr:hypothetical protein [Sphingobacteriia bacterium]
MQNNENITLNFVKFKEQKQFILPWVNISIFALAVAGVFSILIVFLRTPYLQNFLPKDLFSNSLAVHVNLSVLVWMLASLAMWWSIYLNSSKIINLGSAILSGLGALIISLSPFYNFDKPALMNNYVPIIDNPFFFMGLLIFLSGILIISTKVAVNFIVSFNFKDINFNIAASSSVIVVLALCSLVAANNQLKLIPDSSNISKFEAYEMLFWGFGHILQFAFTQGFIGALILITLKDKQIGKGEGFLINLLLWINCLVTILPLKIQIAQNDLLKDYVVVYTNHMKYYGGMVPTIFMIYSLFKLIQNKPKPLFNLYTLSIFGSILLFSVGGYLGMQIVGTNVKIPAHYHGSIVAITIMFMGFYYFLFEKLFDLKFNKSAYYQIGLYAFGQLMHITGLAISGGYGALRKNPNQVIDFKLKITMGIMGLGGLIAIIGGLTFVINMLKYITNVNKLYTKK